MEEEALNIGQVLTPTSERTIFTSLKQSPAKLSVNEISANRGERDVEL